MTLKQIIATNAGTTTWFTGIVDGDTVVVSLERILWSVMHHFGYRTTQLFAFMQDTTFADIDGSPVELVADTTWN